MQPQGYPQTSNLHTKASNPLIPRHEAILRELIRTMMGKRWEPKTGYAISTKSKSGLTKNTYDIDEKFESFRYLTANLPDVAKLIREGNLEKLAERHDIVLAYLIMRRNQNDSVRENGPKDRSALSIGQACGFEEGELIAGRSIAESDKFYRTRSRPVYSGPGAVNYLLASLLQPMRDHYLSEYAFTWKHRSAEDIERKVDGYNVLGVDATQFDQNFKTEAAEIIFDEWSQMYDRDVIDLMRIMWYAPVFCPSPVDGDLTQWAWIGDPLDIDDFKLNRGLPSGISYNPDFGKIWGTAYILFMLDDMTGDVLEFGVHRILKGEHPTYAILNQGDDALFLFKSMELRNLLKERLESGEASPYIDLDIEDPVTFLGWVLTSNGRGYRVVPNIQSMVLNFAGNEHPIGHPRDKVGHRRHWGLGVESWPTVFGVCPEYKKVRRILELVTKEILGKTVSEFAKPYAMESKKVLNLSGLNLDEARLLENPSRRFYSVDMDKVRQPIVDTLIRTISPDEISTRCGRFINPAFK
jgi:hypothetical protein